MPAGRPTKYKKQYCEELIKFFNIEPYREVERRTTDRKSGREYIDYEDAPNDLPTFERFAHNLGVHVDTMIEWSSAKFPEGHAKSGQLKHPEFSVAYKKAKQLQKDILITNAMRGLYNTTFSIFLAKNITDLRDKQEYDLNHNLPTPILGGLSKPNGIPVNDSTTKNPPA